MNNQANIPFNAHDSWAIWDIPKESLLQKTDQERQVLFGECYKKMYFPLVRL